MSDWLHVKQNQKKSFNNYLSQTFKHKHSIIEMFSNKIKVTES